MTVTDLLLGRDLTQGGRRRFHASNEDLNPLRVQGGASPMLGMNEKPSNGSGAQVSLTHYDAASTSGPCKIKILFLLKRVLFTLFISELLSKY